jgi:hypothetical protein
LLAAAFDLCISVGNERRTEVAAVAEAKAPKTKQTVTV